MTSVFLKRFVEIQFVFPTLCPLINFFLSQSHNISSYDWGSNLEKIHKVFCTKLGGCGKNEKQYSIETTEGRICAVNGLSLHSCSPAIATCYEIVLQIKPNLGPNEIPRSRVTNELRPEHVQLMNLYNTICILDRSVIQELLLRLYFFGRN